MSVPKYSATARDVLGAELYAEVSQGAHGPEVRIHRQDAHSHRVLTRLNPTDASVLAQQLLHLANVIRDHQTERR